MKTLFRTLFNGTVKEREDFSRPYSEKKKLPEIKSLKVKPFPYQTEGILFCAAAGRSILADDMGLGENHSGNSCGATFTRTPAGAKGFNNLPHFFKIPVAKRD